MRNNSNGDMLGRSYDSNQLDALFENEDLGNEHGGQIENLGMQPTTPNIDNMNSLETESTVHRIWELLKNG